MGRIRRYRKSFLALLLIYIATTLMGFHDLTPVVRAQNRRPARIKQPPVPAHAESLKPDIKDVNQIRLARLQGAVWSIRADPGLGNTAVVTEMELVKAIKAAGGEIGTPSAATRLVFLKLGADKLAPESYQITSSHKSGPLHLTCTGRDKRGLIYAAYDLAERIIYGEPLERLNISESPYATYRQIVACSSDNEFYARLIRTMPRWRMNGLLLYSAYQQPDRVVPGPLGNFDPAWFSTYLTLPIAYRDYPKVRAMREQSLDFKHVRESFPKLLALARDYQIDVSLKFQILNYNRLDASGGHYFERRQHMREDFPQLFPGGRETPDWNSDAVYNFIRGQLEELFTTYPDLAGITAASQEMAPFGIGHVASGGTPEDRRKWTRRMVDTVEAICTKYGKRCYWDLHGSGSVYLNAMLEIAKERPGGLRLRAESVPFEQVFGDNFPGFPFEKVAAAGDGMCDHDISMENNQDFPWLPNIVDRFVVRHTLAGIKAGLRGGGAMWYIYRPHYSPINSLSQINMELVGCLLWNPEESVDSIWQRWLRRRFGERAAPVAGHLLRSTQAVINGLSYFNNTNATFWFQQDGFPSDLSGHLPYLTEYFQPPGTPLYAHAFNAIAQERAIPISQMREEKLRAIRQATELLNYLSAHKADLNEADYGTLLPRYVALLYAAQAMAQLTEVMYYFTHLHLRAYDTECPSPRHGLEQSLQELERIHTTAVNDDRLLLFEPDVYYRGLKRVFLDNIPSFVADLRWCDRILLTRELSLSELPAQQQAKARHLVEQVKQIRDKFARNVRRELSAEEIWGPMQVIR
jgi:hypothetical protein